MASLRGLTTVALLKANFDAGRDYLDMFLPFVLDALASLPRDEVALPELRAHLETEHRLTIPEPALRVLMTRAKRQGYAKQSANHYLRTPRALEGPRLSRQKATIDAEHEQLARALITYAQERSIAIQDATTALTAILDFLAEHHVALIHGQDIELQPLPGTRADTTTRIVARFIKRILETDPLLRGYLDRMIVGYVLQSALLLKDLRPTRRFDSLDVYLDTRCVLQALRLEGPESATSALEALDLLRVGTARLRVFERTCDEIRSILAAVGSRLHTADGRRSMRPTPLGRHILTNHYTASDLRQAGALLERNLRQLGLGIVAFPARVPEHTLDERELSRRLSTGPREHEDDPRVVHDVDCIAAVLTLRAGGTVESVDRASAIFATVNRRLVGTVEKWFRDQGGRGLAPIIHFGELVDFAWLKNPTVATDLKINELMALCVAALRPSEDMWSHFLEHLRGLERDGSLDGDEAVAVLVSEFTDAYLGELEEAQSAQDVAADSLDSIVRRVRERYREAAEDAIAHREAETDAALQKATRYLDDAAKRIDAEEERRRQVELFFRGRASSLAKRMRRAVEAVVGVAALCGLILGVPGFIGSFPVIVRAVFGLLFVAPALGVTYVNLRYGLSIADVGERVEIRARDRLLDWLLPPEVQNRSPVDDVPLKR